MSRKVASSLILALVITVTIPYGVAPAAAQGGAPGGDFLLSTFEYDDYGAAVAYNSHAQEFLVVWSHQGNIYGQRYDYQGVPQGENFAISVTSFGKYRPAAAYSLSTDSYLVVWEDAREGDCDIYGQLVDADGALLDNSSTPEDEADPAVNFAIYTGNGNQQYVDLAFDGSSYLVVWQGNYQNDSVDVLGSFVQADGAVEPTVFPLGETGSLSYGEPSVAYNTTANEYLVVFQYGEEDDAEIRGRRVHPAGSLPGNEYTIAGQSRAAGPDVAAADWGAYVVVWSDYREAGESNIYGQLVLSGADSSFDGGNFAISTAFANQFFPAIARSPSTGQFLVVWKDGRQSLESGWNIYGQRLLADANLAGNDFAISTTGGDQEDPAIAASQSPDLYFVAWDDRRTGTYDIYGQRVAWTGSLLRHEFGISAQRDDQQFPAVAYNPDDGQYLAVWQDDDAIYAQRLSAEGQPLEDPWALETNGVNWFPDVAYNSRQNEYLVVWSDIRANGFIEGRRVSPAGEATVYIQVPESDDGFSPHITYNETEDRYLVVWHTLDGDIYGRILYGDGLAIGTRTTVCTDASYQSSPVVAFDSEHNRFLVVWSDNRADFGTDLYGRFILPDGHTGGGEFCIAGCADGIDRSDPILVYNPDDQEYLVAYEYQREAADYDIYGQRLGWAGTLAGTEIGIWDQDDAAFQVAPDLLYVSSANRYYVIWADRRDVDNEYDLYGRWLESDGDPATDAIPALRYSGDQIYVRLAYDPDHEQALAVWMDSRNGEDDIYGQLGALDATPPTARFTRDPTVGQPGTTFTFDARASSDNLTPRGALAVRWDFNSDGHWETAFSYDKVITKTVLSSNTYTVTLEVRDLMWLTDTLSLPILVQAASANTPPTATLSISPVVGLAGSTFTLDASGCTDAETPAANLQVRWDWENDGAFDTLWSILKVRTPSYTDAGLHTVRVEVRDEEGLTDAATRNLLVLPSTVITLEVSPAAATMAPGGTVQFRATAWDTYDNEMSSPSVVWSVTDGTAGIIDSRGVFTAGTQAGTYANVIQATSNGVNDTATVTIVWPYRVYLPLVLRNF